MKINYRRIIKVLSSCVAIAMVLIATVAMPVLAVSNKVYTPADLYQGVSTEGDDIIIAYSLSDAGVVPLIYEYPFGSGTSWIDGNRLQWTLAYASGDGDYTFDFRSYILGVAHDPNNTLSISPNFLDISDFKSYSSINMSMTVSGDTGISGSGGSLDGIHFKALWAITWVDADGAKFSTSKSAEVTHQVDTAYGQFRFDVPGTFVIPANAVYMIPQLRVVVTAYGGYSKATTVYMELERSHLYASYNSVVENSVTMNAIKDKLNDIDDSLGNIDQSIQEGNDKLDEIINGNDEMAGQVQEKHEDQQELDDKAQDAMDDIDDRTDLDNVMPEGAMDPEDLAGYADWSDSDAWTQWRFLLKPFFDDASIISIMMSLVAFINISVILMGR